MTTLLHIIGLAAEILGGGLLLFILGCVVVAVFVIWLFGYLTGPGARIFPEWMYRRKTK
jgi:hypothetical protein